MFFVFFYVPFVAKKVLLLAAAVTKYGELHGASSKAHRFARRRCPDVNTLAAYERAGIGDEIFPTVVSGVEPNA